MAENHKPELENTSGPIAFQTEIKELLNILVHSLYTRQEIFLRELLSNASDALTQMRFIQQTDRDILDPSQELEMVSQSTGFKFLYSNSHDVLLMTSF